MRSTSLMRFVMVGLLLASTGCGWWQDRPRLFQRCHRNGDTMSNGYSHQQLPPSYSYPGGYGGYGYGTQGTPCGCSNGHEGGMISGPYLSGPILSGPGGITSGEVLPKPNPAIPRIEENGKQMPWDPKMGTGARTGSDLKTSRP